jgi:hypothetical protein
MITVLSALKFITFCASEVRVILHTDKFGSRECKKPDTFALSLRLDLEFVNVNFSYGVLQTEIELSRNVLQHGHKDNFSLSI